MTSPEPYTRQLQTTPPAAAAAPAEPSPAHKRFNTLIAQIEQARATLAAWQTQIPRFHRAHVKRVVPLIDQLREGRRAAIELADALLDQPGWTKAEAAGLRDWLLERSAEFLDGGDGAAPDPALLALFIKHGGSVSRPATSAGDGSGAPGDAAGAAADEGGGEPGDRTRGDRQEGDDPADDEAEFVRRIEEELAAREAQQAAAREQDKAEAKAARAGRSRKKGKGAKLAGGAADEPLDAAQSVRDIFRKLVSALHPDREPDPVRRAEKTELMQRVNGAYAAQDLLGLLELQLQVAQVDASLLQGASAQRLRHYNQLLAAQLAQLRQEIQHTQWQFEADFGVVSGRLLHPDRLDRLVDQAYQEVTAMVAEQQQEIRILTDRSATRQWLRAIRRRLQW